jgi:hypothetical protein
MSSPVSDRPASRRSLLPAPISTFEFMGVAS